MNASSLRIGLDVAQTCVERAGCGWYADSLTRALVSAAPQHSYILYHHFGGWLNDRTDDGTRIDAANVHSPLIRFNAEDAAALWGEIRRGKRDLPANRTSFRHAVSRRRWWDGRSW